MIRLTSMVIIFIFTVTHVITMTSAYAPVCASSPHTPCPCKKVTMKQRSFTKDGNPKYEMYDDFVCDHSKDTQKRRRWLMSKGLQCIQLSGQQNINYLSKNGEVKEKIVEFKFGCEVRICQSFGCNLKISQPYTKDRGMSSKILVLDEMA